MLGGAHRAGTLPGRAPKPGRLQAIAALVALAAAAAAPGQLAPAPDQPFAAGREVKLAASALPAPTYTIAMEASYDPGERLIAGKQRLRWRNTSSVPVTELQFHLYLNAFANNRTTFFTESGGQLRSQKIPKGKWGWVEVKSMRTADGADLKAGEQYIQPDDGNPDDRTVARYPLPAPLPPGEWIEVDIDFEGMLPGVFARNGAHNDFALGGQWFPKIAVFEDAGARGRAEPGWNAHQYHANSEFFADFGDYDVTLTLPIRYQGHIGGTGRLVEETAAGDQVRARFVQEGVSDFVWTAEPSYVLIKDRFDPERDVPRAELERIAGLLGMTPEEIALQPVDITLLLRPENRNQADRYLSSMKIGLRGYGLRLGAFPFPHFTIVDPPRGATGAGGMEYMTFITLGTHPLLAHWPFDRILAPEMVTIHEFGHNYWMGMSASNEFEESWLDEGINSYYDMIITDESYDNAQVEFLGMKMAAFDNNHASLGAGRYSDPIVRESWRFRNGSSYGFNSYSRSAVTLRHLEGLLGTATFHKAMRHFFQTWKFRHPSTADFKRAIQEVAGQDLDWFFEQAFHSTRALDYGIRTATSTKVKDERGYFWRDGERVLEEESEKGKKGDEEKQKADAEPAPSGETAGSNGEGGDTPADSEEKVEKPPDDYRTVVFVERFGAFVHPVTVELKFADDHVERRAWDGQERWVRYEIVRPSKLVSAEIDPEHAMALDINRLNNSRLIDARPAPAAKIFVHFLFWMQNLLAATALVG